MQHRGVILTHTPPKLGTCRLDRRKPLAVSFGRVGTQELLQIFLGGFILIGCSQSPDRRPIAVGMRQATILSQSSSPGPGLSIGEAKRNL
jgi:hypothetical protein